MRKNKGYQQDWHKRSYRTKEQHNSAAKGENKSMEQCLADIDEGFDLRIKAAYKEYAKIATKTTLVGEDLRKYCRDWMLWEVKFDDNLNLIPLEEAIKQLEMERERYKAWKSYRYFKRFVHKDNQKFVYNSGSGYRGNVVRVPSMKRSDATWKRFYELFPSYKEHYNELKNKNGLKLKKVW